MKAKHVVLLVLVAAIWGGNFAVIQYGLDSVPPLALSAMRFMAAAIPACLLLPPPKVSLLRLIGIGTTLGTLMSAFQFAGMSLGVGVGTSSVVLQSQSIFTIILALLVTGEKPSAGTWCAVGIGVGGLGCFSWTYWEDPALVGLAMVVVAGLWWAVGNLLIKGARQADPVALMAWMSLVPIIPLSVLSLVFEGGMIAILESAATPKGIASAVYLGLGVMICGYGIWSRMLQYYDASRVAPFSLLVPVFGVAFGVVFFDETVTPLQVVGAFLIVSAAALNALPKQRIRQALAVSGE